MNSHSKVLVLGAGGMLGHKLVQRLSNQFETIGTMRQPINTKKALHCFQKAKIITGIAADNITDLTRLLDDIKPTAVINAIGIIKQLKESYDPVPAIGINALFPHQLAKLCQERDIRLVHFSTDCVFDGSRGNYNEKDVPNCTDLYGRSKLLGELNTKGSFTIRSSIIGRELQRGLSLVEWFLSQKGKTVKGYRGALYTGFTTSAMSDIVTDLLTKNAKLDGVWHVSSDEISKYDLLQLINQVYKLNITIEADTDFKCDRRLDSSQFRQATGFKPPSWPAMIEEMAEDSAPYLLD